MEKKFNKANVSEIIQEEITAIQKQYHFFPDQGTNQLLYCSQSKEKETHLAYGKYKALCDLHEELFGNDKNFYVVHG